MAFVEFSRRAPTGFLVVPDNGDPEDDSQTTLIQTDWDYPGVARSMGWGGEDDQFSEAYDWIREHEGEEFEGLDDYLAQENPCMSNPGTADSWNAGREWAKADMASGIKQQYTAEAWERWARTKDWTGYTQKDLDNSRRNFIHAYQQTEGTRGKRNPEMNGRSYVRRGVPPPRYWEPKQGDVVYIEGTKTRLGKPYRDPGDTQTMFPLRPPVHGTTDMGDRNLKMVAMIEPEGERNPGGFKRETENLFEHSFEAGKWWAQYGAHESGVANAGVRHYGFIKWWNEQDPAIAGRVLESMERSPFEENFNRGYAYGRKLERTGNPMKRHKYEVIVGNIGTVYSGNSKSEAVNTYNGYVDQSVGGRGRAGGEDVTMMADGEPYREHFGGTSYEENPKTGADHPLAWDLANFARSKYSRRAVHIKAVTDYLIKLRDQGNYNLKSATKAYYYVIEGAAKEYGKEYGTKPPGPAVKLEAARDLMSMVEGGRG